MATRKEVEQQGPSRAAEKRTCADHALQQCLAGLTAKLSRLAALQERIKKLNHKAERVFEAAHAKEEFSEESDTTTQSVRGQCEVLLAVLTGLQDDGKNVHEMESLVCLANAKCDLITAMIQQPSFAPSPLLTLPECCFTSYIGPLLGTRSIIGRLALSNTALHALSRKPTTHQTLHLRPQSKRFDWDTPVDLTDKQVAAWRAAFRKTKRAVVGCAPRMGLVHLLEHAREALTELEAWSDAHYVDDGRSLERREETEGDIAFSLLARVKVAGWWICVANRRRWTAMSLTDVHLRNLLIPQHHQSEWMQSHPAWLGGRGAEWVAYGRSDILHHAFHHADQIFEATPDRHLVAAIPRLQLEELDACIDRTDGPVIEGLEVLRSMFVAPTGKLTVACRAFVMFDTLRELGHLELHPLWSDTLTQLGSAARRVAFPSGLPKGAAVPSAVMRHVPHMMFSHAQQLLLQGAGADSITLPSVFLSHISDRNFPRVYTMDLGEARGVRQDRPDSYSISPL
ncbi:unnamed protein product [Vitrella brassicaformis CCMP3155]|uniref:Uncharacterized protein n=2 Tax=Vitrella brassicaformis TaxID=1169539 RepID=A0A0G4F6R6_VITBC|nr:unnamed protein product [Vitrella brassicaformis CCMP3155]|eukprot:CEM07813.1 unnamed protein product [Vitrella brassicaformis CCMP3155]